MAEILLTSSGGAGSLNLAWDFSSLSGSTFNVVLKRTLNATTKTVHTIQSTTTKTIDIVTGKQIGRAHV